MAYLNNTLCLVVKKGHGCIHHWRLHHKVRKHRGLGHICGGPVINVQYLIRLCDAGCWIQAKIYIWMTVSIVYATCNRRSSHYSFHLNDTDMFTVHGATQWETLPFVIFGVFTILPPVGQNCRNPGMVFEMFETCHNYKRQVLGQARNQNILMIWFI